MFLFDGNIKSLKYPKYYLINLILLEKALKLANLEPILKGYYQIE